VQDHQFLVLRPPLPEAGPLLADLASSISEAPRLKKIRMEMMPKNQKKTPARRHRLLLRSLKTLVWTRRESVSMTLLLRVPLFREQWLIKLLF
jgi:hypothetical protein